MFLYLGSILSQKAPSKVTNVVLKLVVGPAILSSHYLVNNSCDCFISTAKHLHFYYVYKFK